LTNRPAYDFIIGAKGKGMIASNFKSVFDVDTAYGNGAAGLTSRQRPHQRRFFYLKGNANE